MIRVISNIDTNEATDLRLKKLFALFDNVSGE